MEELLPGQIVIFDYFEKKTIEHIKIKLFELFSGYGSQSLALEMFGVDYESVGYAEIDKYAIQAYKSLHGDHITNYGDVTKLEVDKIPYMDLLTYSFPCQDISVAGKGRGLAKDSGTRSSLLWECERIIASKRPKFLMMENVKNLIGKSNKPHFDEWLQVLSNLGYNNYWKVTNAKHCGIPQNRERVFCVSILKEFDDGSFKFEEPFDNGVRLKDLLESEVDEKYYINKKPTKWLCDHFQKNQVCQMYGTKIEPNPSGGRVYNTKDIMRTLGSGNGMSQPMIITNNNEIHQIANIIKTDSFGGNPQAGRIYGVDGISPTINTCGGGHRKPKVFTQYRIRKLTPKECFRLMGLNDQQIAKIQNAGISNSQQYKLAGNSIVVHQMAFLANLPGIIINVDTSNQRGVPTKTR